MTAVWHVQKPDGRVLEAMLPAAVRGAVLAGDVDPARDVVSIDGGRWHRLTEIAELIPDELLHITPLIPKGITLAGGTP